MNLSRPFILRPIATSLLMIAILLSGLFAYRVLPIASLPEVDYPTIRVLTLYPGASPEVTASTITAPLERQLGQMPGLNQMTSTSSNGASTITLQFSLDLSLDIAEQEVQAAINAASNFLPQDLPTPPVYSKVNPADAPIMTLALTSRTMPLAMVEDFADTHLVQKISQQPGVGLVSLSGGQRPAVRIQVNPDVLAAYGLTLEAIRTAVTTANVNAAKGNFDGPRLSYTINTNDQLREAADYRQVVIAYKNNAPIYLSDVADVRDDIENKYQSAWVKTTPAILLNIQKQPGTNVIQVADHIHQLLEQLRKNMPAAIQLDLLMDRTKTIRASVQDVQTELLFSVALVVMVIFLFLRSVPATIIPSIVVPLSLIGTFGVMYLFEFSLNNLTLMGLTIATGFVIDDAIIMIENIMRYIELGESPSTAALKGAKQIGFTILSLTVSLVAVMIPLLFMQDIVGRLFREFAITVSTTIFISAFISLTLTPMMCAHMLRSDAQQTQNIFLQKAETVFDYLLMQYRASLQWVLSRQNIIRMMVVIIVVLTGVLFYSVPKGFFPTQDIGVIQGISEAKQSISFSAMSEKQLALVKAILDDSAVENISTFIGVDGTNNTLNSGRLSIILKPLADRHASVSMIIQRLNKKLAQLPGISLYLQPMQDLTIDDRVSRTQYQYSVNAPDRHVVSQWTQRLVNQLQQSTQLDAVSSDLQELGLGSFVIVDRDTASRLGVSMQTIGDTLYSAFGQRQISTILTQQNQYRVILEVAPRFQSGPDALEHLYFSNAEGRPIPLSAFSAQRQQQIPLVINRQGQFPVATISFNLAPGVALSEAVREIEEKKAALSLPLNVETHFEGAARVFENARNHQLWLVFAAVIVVYLVLGILYESYIHPITILSTLPSAGMGALLILLLSNTDLSVVALIGIILLIGIVMKNAIMMIDFALEQERVYGKKATVAIYEAAVLRFRPILMTSCAAMLGAVPLIWGGGVGAELRRPLGLVILSGLAFSQLMTLYTTPVVYLAFDRGARRFMLWRKKR